VSLRVVTAQGPWLHCSFHTHLQGMQSLVTIHPLLLLILLLVLLICCCCCCCCCIGLLGTVLQLIIGDSTLQLNLRILTVRGTLLMGGTRLPNSVR